MIDDLIQEFLNYIWSFLYPVFYHCEYLVSDWFNLQGLDNEILTSNYFNITSWLCIIMLVVSTFFVVQLLWKFMTWVWRNLWI